MIHYQIAVVVGSLRRASFNRQLAYLDVPTMGQPEAFIQAKDGLFHGVGNIGQDSLKFMQNWMDHYVVWVKKHAVART